MTQSRVFLFLQGPHGPFFHALAGTLRAAGQRALKIGFNGGDQLFWPNRASYTAFDGPAATWRDFLGVYLDTHKVTDLVIYGDSRDIHTTAREEALLRGITLHYFEEGYLRPYWITYERGGVNGHSRLMQMSVSQMERALGGRMDPQAEAPAEWGALWQHVVLGAVYHAAVMLWAWRYREYRPHRAISVLREWGLYLRRLVRMPWHGIQRRVASARLSRSGAPYHLVLLQLAHDAAVKDHSPFADQDSFVRLCCNSFADAGLTHHRLVFKVHPLEDDRESVARLIRRSARARGLQNRVHIIRGGKLAPLLNRARSAVTINSTAGQQALWRGLPLRIFGQAVYAKAGFTSQQSLTAFFQNPDPPDRERYHLFRAFLLRTSQLTGGYYTRTGRAQVLRKITDVMLAQLDPYERVFTKRLQPRRSCGWFTHVPIERLPKADLCSLYCAQQ
ncbi:MAG: capsule biosynthesis protein CapA [Pseudomonadota bacterium]